jgi:hypothetical protein
MNLDLSFRDLPITSYSDLERAIRMLLSSHPLLAPLVAHIDSQACEIDYSSLYVPGDELCGATFRSGDWMDAVNHTVDALVSFNNERWNFAPGGAPLRIDPSAARLVALCLYMEQDLVEAQVTDRGLVVLSSTGDWKVSIWKSGNAYYLPEVTTLGRWSLKSSAREAFAALVGEGE